MGSTIAVLQRVMATTDFAALSDADLIAEARRLAVTERTATAALVRSLVELSARGLYRGQGCGSLYTFCTQVLGLSEDAAYNRIEVADLARRFPLVLDALDDGSLTLTAARRLAPCLTESNHVDVLKAARHKGKRELEELIARLAPRPDAPTEIARVDDADRTRVTPLSAERYRLQFTIGRDVRDKLQDVQDLLRHSIPDGNLEEIFDRALTLLLHKAQRQRFAATTGASRVERPLVAGSRCIRARVRREVWRRDQGRCAFVGPHGRCTETTLLQFHHKVPFAAGGAATVENIELRCATHNRYEAELYFGADYPWLVRDEELVPERGSEWHNSCAIRCG